MKQAKKSVLFVFLVIALLAIPTLVVFAKELGMLTISGPGIKGEVTLNDSNAMMDLEKSGFFDEATLSVAPKNLNLEAGYTITAHLNLDGKVVPFVQMVYYPTQEGQAGYLHYIGRLDGQTLKTVDEWQLMRLSADQTLRGLMTANHVTVQSALEAAPVAAASTVKEEPVSAAAVTPAAFERSYLLPLLIITLVLLAGAVVLLRRRTISRPTV
jgi:hypothetical protein